jgi:integrase
MELLHLHVEDLDLERRCILVIDRGREGGNSLKTLAAAQPVPIPEVLVPIVEAWLLHRLDVPTGFRIPEFVPWLIPNLKRTGAWTGGPLRSKPTDCVKNLAARAGIQGMTLQSLRRSLATHLEGHGMGQPLISRILRHTTPETSLRWYQKADIPNLVQSVRDFSYDA